MQQLRRIRQEHQWSQYELARRTGIPQSFISKLENGKAVGSVQTLQKLAIALNTTTDILLQNAD